MTKEEARERQVQVQRDRCPYCHDPVAPSQEKLSCDGCMAWHHEECWHGHGACSACGHEQFAGAQSQGSDAKVGGRDRCACAGCEQPVTSFDGDYDVQIDGRQRVSIKRVCTEHAIHQLQGFATQTLALGIIMGSLAALVTVLIFLRGMDVSGWQAQFILTGIFLLGGLVGFGAWRKYLREIRQLEDAERTQGAGKA